MPVLVQNNQSNVPTQSNIVDTRVPRLDLSKFEGSIKNHGIEVVLERAVKCACASRSFNGSYDLACKGCFGYGWHFVSPVNTLMIVQGINRNSKVEPWSEENTGTISVTSAFVDRVSFMDRITLVDGLEIHTQLLNPVEDRADIIAYCVYEPIDIYHFFYFDAAKKELVTINKTEYTVVKNKIKFNRNFIKKMKFSEVSEFKISIRYTFKPQYHIWDISRDVMISKIKKCNSDLEKAQFPIHSLGRIAHNVLMQNV